MIVKSSTKSCALERQELGERRAAARLVVGQDHLAHRDDAVALEEHVLGAAEADALGAELARRLGVAAACRRWRAPSCVADLVGPAHQGRELAGQLRLLHRDLAEQHLPVEPSMVIDVAGLERGRPPTVKRAGLA